MIQSSQCNLDPYSLFLCPHDPLTVSCLLSKLYVLSSTHLVYSFHCSLWSSFSARTPYIPGLLPVNSGLNQNSIFPRDAASFLSWAQRRCWHSPSFIAAIFRLLPQGQVSVLCGLSCGMESSFVPPSCFHYGVHHHMLYYLYFLIFCVLEILAFGNLILGRLLIQLLFQFHK